MEKAKILETSTYLYVAVITVFSTIFVWGVIFPKENVVKASYIEIQTEVKQNLSNIDQVYKLRPSIAENTFFETIVGTEILTFDSNSHQTYYSRNSDERRPIASITKLMTVLVALDVYKLDQIIDITITPERLDLPLNLSIGDKVRVSELFEATLIASKNEAAIILANEYGYSEFIDLMNMKAKVLGMLDSHFSNPSGYYDVDNYSTASDLRKLSKAVLSHKYVREVVSRKTEVFEYTSNIYGDQKINLVATNDLFNRTSTVIGLKTGFTYRSGPSLIALFKDDNLELVTILLNSTDRFGETVKLYNTVKSNYSLE